MRDVVWARQSYVLVVPLQHDDNTPIGQTFLGVSNMVTLVSVNSETTTGFEDEELLLYVREGSALECFASDHLLHLWSCGTGWLAFWVNLQWPFHAGVLTGGANGATSTLHSFRVFQSGYQDSRKYTSCMQN